jgi:transcriptional antiterminator RfaH
VDLHPTDLLSSVEFRSVSTKGPSDAGWWLAHTRPRQEKAAAADFLARDVAFYLPLLSRTSVSRGRPRLAREPLFPGYVFVYGDGEDRLTALKTNRLLTVQHVPDGERLRGELSQFAELIAAGARLTRESRLVAGERVRIKAGPFRDIEGVILRRNGKTELLVAIDFLSQGASLEVDECMLEPI